MYMQIFNCAGVGTPKLGVVRGSAVLGISAVWRQGALFRLQWTLCTYRFAVCPGGTPESLLSWRAFWSCGEKAAMAGLHVAGPPSALPSALTCAPQIAPEVRTSLASQCLPL